MISYTLIKCFCLIIEWMELEGIRRTVVNNLAAYKNSQILLWAVGMIDKRNKKNNGKPPEMDESVENI